MKKFNDFMEYQSENSKIPTKVFVKKANVSEYFLDKITLIFNENFISRKDIFVITQSLIGQIAYLEKKISLIPRKEENPMNNEVGYIGNFKCSKFLNPKGITGLITSSTIFNLRSSAASVYFLIEISKETFDFAICSKLKYELIIDFIKSTLQHLKKSSCNHSITFIFFTRIFLNKKEIIKINKNNNTKKENFFFEFLYDNPKNNDECFFDLYSQILKLNTEKFDLLETVETLQKAFLKFGSIFKVKSLFEYVNLIKEEQNNFIGKNRENIFEENFNGCNGNTKFSKFDEYAGNMNNNNLGEQKSFFFNEIYSLRFLKEIESLKLCKSNNSNLLESINILLNDIKYEKDKIFKLGNMINVIMSGDCFPYYNKQLSKITKENVYQQGIATSLIIMSEKNKSELYVMNNLNISLNVNSNNINNIINNSAGNSNTYSNWLSNNSNNNSSSLRNYNSIGGYNNNQNLEKESSFSPKFTEFSKDRERGFSLYSKNWNNYNINEQNESDIQIKIDKNKEIMKFFDPCVSLRKNSFDINGGKEYTNLTKYIYTADIFSHKIPNWLKTFYLGPKYFLKKKKEDSNKNPQNNFSKFNKSKNLFKKDYNFLNNKNENISFGYNNIRYKDKENIFSSQKNREFIYKKQFNTPFFLDNEIMNSRKIEKIDSEIFNKINFLDSPKKNSFSNKTKKLDCLSEYKELKAEISDGINSENSIDEEDEKQKKKGK